MSTLGDDDALCVRRGVDPVHDSASSPLPELPPSPPSSFPPSLPSSAGEAQVDPYPTLDEETEWEDDVDEPPVHVARRIVTIDVTSSPTSAQPDVKEANDVGSPPQYLDTGTTEEEDNVDEIPVHVVSPTAARLRQERREKWELLPRPRHPRDNPSNSGVASDSGSFRWGDESSAGSDVAKWEEQLSYNRRCSSDSGLRAERWKRIEAAQEAASAEREAVEAEYRRVKELKSAERRRVKRERSSPQLVGGWSWVPGPGRRAYPGSVTNSYSSDAE